MLQETKRDLMICARQLSKPYEKYSIDELADAYCEAEDTNNSALQGVYFAALLLRFWYQIPKIYSELQAYRVEHTDCYDGVVDAICQACAADNRKWQTTNLSAEQVINQILRTRFKAAKIYEANLQKNAGRHLEVSIDAPVCGGDGDDSEMTVADTLEDENSELDINTDAVISLVQSYINRNKVIEAILIDNIAFNDVQKHYKKVVKAVNASGKTYRYTEHSSEFWPYKLIQTVNKLPDTYKIEFMTKYSISEEKLNAVLATIDQSNNQKLYKYLKHAIDDLKVSYSI
jgi:hypothetical protein